MNEKHYNNLLQSLKKELNHITYQLTENQSKTPRSRVPELQNLQFELQILIHTLTEFPQFDELNKIVIINMTDANKDRLIGFLMSKI